MIFLLAFFGFFSILSIAALIKFSGNPVFLFTLLLCLASLVTLWRADREDSSLAKSGARRGRKTRSAPPARRRSR